jgi:hypothetical protein
MKSSQPTKPEEGNQRMNIAQPSVGSLIVNVRYADGAYPVEGAVAEIYKKDEEGLTLIGVLTTNEDGKSAPIIIETPDPALSLSPNPPQKPYTSVTVNVSKEGFYEAQFVDLPVFPGILSIQNVNLIPHPQFYTNQFYADTVFKESEAADL